MKPDAVVFDFDGVLADSEPLHLRVYQELLAAEDITLPPAEYYARYLGYDDVGVFEALARDKGLRIENGRLDELIARKTGLFQRRAAVQRRRHHRVVSGEWTSCESPWQRAGC